MILRLWSVNAYAAIEGRQVGLIEEVLLHFYAERYLLKRLLRGAPTYYFFCFTRGIYPGND
jgi:hypothetical protein